MKPARDDQRVNLRVLIIAGLAACSCGTQEKKKSDDPTVVAEDLDEPVDLSVNGTGAFWTTRPLSQSMSATGSGKPSALQFVALDGGDVRTLISGLNRPSSISTDDERVYWLDLNSKDEAQLNAMRFNGDERVVLLDFGAFTDDVPTSGTRLIPFRGKLYFGGVMNLWAVPVDGGVPESLLRARIRGGDISVALVDENGIHFRERNLGQGIDLKHVPLSGAGPGEDPGAWVLVDGGVDAGVSDAGVDDAGVDGGLGDLPPEAPGVTVLRRGFVLGGTTNVAIANDAVWWFSNGLLGGTLYRAPFNGGPTDEVLRFPSNGGATDLASGGHDVLYLVSTNVGGLLYRVDDDTPKELHQLGLLNSGTPRVLRLDATSAWFFAGAGTLSRLHRVQRLRGLDAGVMDVGIDAGP
ncbi:MAG: hypothetical protein ACO1OB_22805 [Archangium sp.]